MSGRIFRRENADTSELGSVVTELVRSKKTD